MTLQGRRCHRIELGSRESRTRCRSRHHRAPTVPRLAAPRANCSSCRRDIKRGWPRRRNSGCRHSSTGSLNNRSHFGMHFDRKSKKQSRSSERLLKFRVSHQRARRWEGQFSSNRKRVLISGKLFSFARSERITALSVTAVRKAVAVASAASATTAATVSRAASPQHVDALQPVAATVAACVISSSSAVQETEPHLHLQTKDGRRAMDLHRM